MLSVKDEFYHRHIIQYNLFETVFHAFRLNPVGDNLVSSAIIEVSPIFKFDVLDECIYYLNSYPNYDYFYFQSIYFLDL